MKRRACRAVLTTIVLSACASVPPPATRSPGSPAHPDAPEAATAPLTPMLAGPGGEPAPSPSPTPHPHSGPAGGAAPAAAYSCPMHPEVEAGEPGACRVCGMALVRTEAGGGAARP